MPVKKTIKKTVSLTPDGRMTLKDAAKYIGCCVTTLRKYLALGAGPASFKVMGKLFFFNKDIDNWLEIQRVSPAFTRSRIAVQRKKDEIH